VRSAWVKGLRLIRRVCHGTIEVVGTAETVFRVRFWSVLALSAAMAMGLACGDQADDSQNRWPLRLPLSFKIGELSWGYPEDNSVKWVLELQTDSQYECYNYAIETIMCRRGTRLDITLLDVTIDPICFTSFGPATAHIDLGRTCDLTSLIVRHQGLVDSFSVTVADGATVIEPRSGQIARVNDSLHWMWVANTPSLSHCRRGVTPREWWIHRPD